MGGGSYREPRVFKGLWPLGQCLLTCPCTPHPQQVSKEGRTGSSQNRGARLSAWLLCNSVTVACRPFTMSIIMVSCVWSGDLVAAAATCRVGGGVVSSSSSAVRPYRVLRARMMWASSGPRAKLLAVAVRQARRWMMCTRAGHSAMVATSSNSLLNCSTSPSPPKFGGLEAVPVTRWHLTLPLQSLEGCDQHLNSEGWCLHCLRGRVPWGHLVPLNN